MCTGFSAGLAWLGLFTLLGTGPAGHLWWLVASGVVAWVAALGLAYRGDRGAAVGVAAATGLGWAGGGALVALYWGVTGDWPLW